MGGPAAEAWLSIISSRKKSILSFWAKGQSSGVEVKGCCSASTSGYSVSMPGIFTGSQEFSDGWCHMLSALLLAETVIMHQISRAEQWNLCLEELGSDICRVQRRLTKGLGVGKDLTRWNRSPWWKALKWEERLAGKIMPLRDGNADGEERDGEQRLWADGRPGGQQIS